MIVTIEKLVFGGQGLGYSNGSPVFVWNALPGEEVLIKNPKKKGRVYEGTADEILKASPARIKPEEDHFLSCSPWQIMSFADENRWKCEIAEETYRRLGAVQVAQKMEIFFDDRSYGYRNKMEFGFMELGNREESGEVSLAFFERGTKHCVPAAECRLAENSINVAARKIVQWLNKNKIKVSSLDKLLIRSDDSGHTAAILYVRGKINYASPLGLDKSLVGFHIYRSTDESDKNKLYTSGQNFLSITLLERTLHFPLAGFFQINAPVFEESLRDIKKFLEKDAAVIDFYSGVGSIALPLADSFENAVLVESNEEAATFAQKNIELNAIKNCTARAGRTEHLLDLITRDKIIILDPPRAGLAPAVVKRILAETPRRIIYLSCDIATHARDIKLLKEKYAVRFLKLYNFFPRTPHIESLCMLDCTL